MSPVLTTERDDVETARAGGTRGAEACARLFDRHAPLVLALCRGRFPAGSGEPDDALQETFIRAFAMLDRLDQPEGIRGWLLAIAGRICAERDRARRRRSMHEHAAGGHGISPNGRHDPRMAMSPDCREQHARLDRALQRLPEPLRLALHLHYHDIDPDAAARTLGLSRSAYYKRLAQARDRLAALLMGAALT